MHRVHVLDINTKQVEETNSLSLHMHNLGLLQSTTSMLLFADMDFLKGITTPYPHPLQSAPLSIFKTSRRARAEACTATAETQHRHDLPSSFHPHQHAAPPANESAQLTARLGHLPGQGRRCTSSGLKRAKPSILGRRRTQQNIRLGLQRDPTNLRRADRATK